jgi:tetratricopeptide (TPR) repeat protein
MDNSDSDSDDGLGFANLDLAGVDFDQPDENNPSLNDNDRFAMQLELETVASQWGEVSSEAGEEKTAPENSARVAETSSLLSTGQYIEVLKGEFATSLLNESCSSDGDISVWNTIRQRILSKCTTVVDCVEAEFVGIAAFNLFQQLNYTGPTFDVQTKASGVNPHECFQSVLKAEDDGANSNTITAKRHTSYHNAVLSELACDGQWPCQVVEAPYFLLLARCIFLTLADPSRACWASFQENEANQVGETFTQLVLHLYAASIWSARATVAHERLLLTGEPTVTLWKEIETIFPQCVRKMAGHSRYLRAMVILEFGLACHHFDRPRQGKMLFLQAKETSGLFLEVTGADGKRTKFQSKATAQLVVRASSVKERNKTPSEVSNGEEDKVQFQMIGFSEEGILHERVKFEDEEENRIRELTILDQAILLGLCLDIKDNNPADQLTAEEMSAYLSRVLCHHDDWIVYSTALLERAWLEFEGNHTKERSILQMQALADQHTDRLTITQSTRKSIEDSSPVQDRLKNLHSIVYPPRWQMLRDVAERYAQIGIVTSAAEIFAEIESWDEVVDCYCRAGKEKRAEEIVRERLAINETPRMWTALGDITNEPKHYEKAVELSRGRFSQAHISLGKFYFDSGDLQKSAENYRHALKLRPLIPSVWFRVGTICMQLEDWDGALSAFTEVVQQRPEEGEAWANVAAIHMHNKHPNKAYPALVESLKHDRNNLRVWVSKLYTCLDLRKFDEAAQACNVLLDAKGSKASRTVPELEEKCVRALVGGTVGNYITAKEKADKVALDSSRRSLVRVQELLDRIATSTGATWVYEAQVFLYGQVGLDVDVFENLMKEYRSLTSVRSWEKDDQQVVRVCRTVSQIVHYQGGTKEELTKSKFLLSGVLKRITHARLDGGSCPDEIKGLETLLAEVATKLEE